MRARPSTVLPHPLALAFAVALVALAASCARELPTAVSHTTASAAAPRAATHRDNFDIAALPNEVVITLAPGVSPDSIAASTGATVRNWAPDERVATLVPGPGDTAASLLAKLGVDKRILTYETNGVVEPAEARQRSFAFDDGLGSLATTTAQPALTALHTLQAQAVSLGQGVKVAILDTGADPTHPLLANRIVAAEDFVTNQFGADDIAQGLDTNGDGTVDGAWGHGTHVAGIVALTAPGAQLLIGRVLDSDGVGDVTAVAAGIRWAVQSGARIINLSLGTLGNSSAIQNAIEEAEEHDVIVLASAGNSGVEFPQEYPARSEDVLAVAATDVSGTPAPWTSYGDFVAISAPGVAIRSAYPGGAYRLWSGTSMSTPFVTGTTALLLAAHRSWSREDVMFRLRLTATPLANVTVAEDGKLGCGMLDVGGALAPDASIKQDNIIVQNPGHGGTGTVR